MFDRASLQALLEKYKQDFSSMEWPKEVYKWEAVQHFQTHWDIHAEDFAGMLQSSLSKTYNLLASQNNYPARMVVEFAKMSPEEVRGMFMDLFDEKKDVYERMSSFKAKADKLLQEYGNGAGLHYQSENAISIYLWLQYPDKYYIYRYGESKTLAETLKSDYQFKKGAYADNVRNFYRFYDEINAELLRDEELVTMLREQITDTCYPDPQLKTLTSDLGFYSKHYYVTKTDGQAEENDSSDDTDSDLTFDDWGPTLEQYDPGITEEKWLDLLHDPEVIGPIWGGVLAAFYGMGGEATCKQIALKYDKNAMAVRNNCLQLAKKVYSKTNCPIRQRDNGQKSYWPILFFGKNAGPDIPGEFIWKLRPELFNALTTFDIMRYEWKNEESAEAEENADRHYWWLNANPKIWSFSDLAVGGTQAYTLYNDNGNKRRIFQNFLDAKAGDMVIGYESYPVKQIVSIATVKAEQDGQEILFEKVEGLASPVDYSAIRDCPELAEMEYFVNPQGSFFKLTKDEYNFIIDTIRDENPLKKEASAEKYTKSDFLNEVYIPEQSYDNLVGILQNKKNVILQGAPGVGKTFTARRLAWSMMGEKDDDRIEFVQFHQNYSYEDFVMGYKPVENGFELKNGIFYRFCQKAANQPGKDFFFIIDEINRGNLSKIFGELLMLIEKDYRGTSATLAYTGMPFSVPDNLYIIGMMNTADRSLAMIDYALRRRFSFFEMNPGFDSEGFKKYQNSLNNETLNELIDRVQDLNRKIAADKSLGKGFCIGHSYFCGCKVCTDEWMQSIVEYDILPMLSEYWFDDSGTLQQWENILRGVFQ